MLVLAARIFSAVLVVTGSVKIGRPQNTARALRIAGLPFPRLASLMVGFGEVATGVSCLLIGEMAFLAQSAVYLAFGVWAIRAMWAGLMIETCGCVGKPDTPPSWSHVAINGGAVALSFGAAFTAAPLDRPELVASIAAYLLIGAGVLAVWVLLGDSARVAGMLRDQ